MITAHDHSEASTRKMRTPFTTQSELMKMARAEKSAAPRAPGAVESMLALCDSGSRRGYGWRTPWVKL
jgi:hypothetical protein